MTIKKLSKEEILIQNSQEDVKVKCSTTLTLVVNTTENLDKPGEYEYKEINVTALEVPNGEYKAQIDFSKINLEGIDVGVLSTDITYDKDALKDVANIDVLVIFKGLSSELIGKFINYFDPEVLLLIGFDEESAKKELSLTNVASEKQYKAKVSDFSRGESKVVRTLILG